MSNIYLDRIQESLKTNSEYAFLSLTTPIRQWKDTKIKDTLSGLYHPPRSANPTIKLNSKLMGVFLNAILTQRRLVFMNTYRDFNKLLAQDKDLKRETLNGDEFKAFNHYLLFNKFIDVVRPPLKDKAGIYKIIDKTLLELIFTIVNGSLFEAQMSQCIEIYDEKTKPSQKTSLKSSHSYGREEEHEHSNESSQECGSQGEKSESAASTTTNRKSSSTFGSASLPSEEETPLESLVPINEKIRFCLKHPNFNPKSMTSFEDFLDLVENKHKVLTPDSLKWVEDQYRKLSRLAKLDKISVYKEYAKHVGCKITFKQMEEVHNIMFDTYYSRDALNDSQNNLCRDEMVEMLKLYKEVHGFNNKFDEFWLMLARKFNGRDPYKVT